MAVKLNHYWSIIPGMNKEYEKFVLRKFIPGVNGLGMHTVAVWSVLIGACGISVTAKKRSTMSLSGTSIIQCSMNSAFQWPGSGKSLSVMAPTSSAKAVCLILTS